MDSRDSNNSRVIVRKSAKNFLEQVYNSNKRKSEKLYNNREKNNNKFQQRKNRHPQNFKRRHNYRSIFFRESLPEINYDFYEPIVLRKEDIYSSKFSCSHCEEEKTLLFSFCIGGEQTEENFICFDCFVELLRKQNNIPASFKLIYIGSSTFAIVEEEESIGNDNEFAPKKQSLDFSQCRKITFANCNEKEMRLAVDKLLFQK